MLAIEINKRPILQYKKPQRTYRFIRDYSSHHCHFQEVHSQCHYVLRYILPVDRLVQYDEDHRVENFRPKYQSRVVVVRGDRRGVTERRPGYSVGLQFTRLFHAKMKNGKFTTFTLEAEKRGERLRSDD